MQFVAVCDDFIQIQNQQDVLAEHAQKRFEFLTQRNSISYARQHPEQFVGADDAKLAKELSDITNAINTMETEASACLRDASHCTFTPFDISDFPLPPPLPPSPTSHDTWVAKAPMPTARGDLSVAAARNGKVYAAGGLAAGIFPAITLATLEEYDPAANSWATKAPMPTGRSNFGLAAADNGKIYAVGGLSAAPNDPNLATVEEYDPATNSWATKAPMPTRRAMLGLVAARNGKLYAVGGGGGDTGTVSNRLATVEEYDPVTDRWTAKAPMPTARVLLGLAGRSPCWSNAARSRRPRLIWRRGCSSPGKAAMSEEPKLPTGKEHVGFVQYAGLVAQQEFASFLQNQPLDAELLGKALNALYQIATCHRVCRGGGHMLERLCGRAYNMGCGAFHLLALGLYDESLSLIRGLGELSNLLSLSAADPVSLQQWIDSDSKTRMKKFKPSHVRSILESKKWPFLYGKKWYGELSESYIHLAPNLKPNDHSGQSMVGGRFQETGARKVLDELVLVTAGIAGISCRSFGGFEDLVEDLLTTLDKKPNSPSPSSAPLRI